MPLFENTALIELGEWFDKDEANAVFALIFSFLYEARLSGFQDQAGDAPLLHVAVLDEAHRIVPGESGSGDGQLVSAQDETSSLLSQMIAECRALGQGLIFAEQSASTIASSVLINSSTKIVHGVTYGRDKEFLKSALGLSDQETDYLSFIERGEALAISPLTYQPVLVRVPRAK
jgi:DNA helicase HerA-like ATPase